jgi:N-acetylglucosamine malate deacetylase 1
MTTTRVLVVAAHPDDEILGVGGTVRRHAEDGHDVRSFVACEGVSMRYEDDQHRQVALQARAAAVILGVGEVVLGGLPDQRLDTVPLVEVVERIEEQVQTFRPDVVYTHCGQDLNRDHRVLLEAVQVATRPYPAPFVREVLLFETASSSEWGHPSLQRPFVPEVFVDISSTLEAKITAFCQYRREIRRAPHPRSPESLRARAVSWGSHVGVAAAEPFQVHRMLR